MYLIVFCISQYKNYCRPLRKVIYIHFSFSCKILKHVVTIVVPDSDDVCCTVVHITVTVRCFAVFQTAKTIVVTLPVQRSMRVLYPKF